MNTEQWNKLYTIMHILNNRIRFDNDDDVYLYKLQTRSVLKIYTP
jgi:hypothetical protein